MVVADVDSVCFSLGSGWVAADVERGCFHFGSGRVVAPSLENTSAQEYHVSGPGEGSKTWSGGHTYLNITHASHTVLTRRARHSPLSAARRCVRSTHKLEGSENGNSHGGARG